MNQTKIRIKSRLHYRAPDLAVQDAVDIIQALVHRVMCRKRYAAAETEIFRDQAGQLSPVDRCSVALETHDDAADVRFAWIQPQNILGKRSYSIRHSIMDAAASGLVRLRYFAKYFSTAA